MKYKYPAIVNQYEENRFEAYFPDLEGCSVSGTSMMDVIDEARQAAKDWIEVELEDPNGNLPLPTLAEDITLTEHQTICQIIVNVNVVGGWTEYQPVRPV